MTFNEANTVEAFFRDLLCGGVTHHTAVGPGFARRHGTISGLGWHYLAHQHIPRQPQDVFVESFVREALVRLNPEIAANPDRADEVLYKLRAIVLSVRSDGIIKANEEFTAWLRGDRSMPFGPNHEHTTPREVDAVGASPLDSGDARGLRRGAPRAGVRGPARAPVEAGARSARSAAPGGRPSVAYGRRTRGPRVGSARLGAPHRPGERSAFPIAPRQSGRDSGFIQPGLHARRDVCGVAAALSCGPEPQ